MDDRAWTTDETRGVAEMLKDIDICMLVTRHDGGVRGRPMSNNGKVEYDGDSWFFTFRDSGKVADVSADPTVELAYVATEKGTWVSVEGRADIVDDAACKEALWEDGLEQWFTNGPDDPEVVLLKVRADRVHAWANGEERIIEPGKATQVIEGAPDRDA